jgi:hypothetical protein
LKGRPFSIDKRTLNGLLLFVEQVRDEGNAVSTTLITVELLRWVPELAEVGFIPLHHWVLRFLKNHHLTICVVTHKAQNHHFQVAIIADHTMFVNRQIVVSNYTADCILNFDETNIDFDPSPRSTLSKVGKRSISIHILGHSGISTVMLGCTVSGFKFPAILSSGKVSQMPVLTERLTASLIHMITSSMLFNQRDGWMVQPTKPGYHMSWLLMQQLISTKSTFFRICSLSIYTATASLL